DAVQLLVAEALARVGPRPGPRHILALEVAQAQPVRAMTFGDAPLYAPVVGDDAGQPVAVLALDPVRPQRRRLVGVSVGGHHEVLVGRAWSCRARPAGVTGTLEPPTVWLVDHDVGGDHGTMQASRRRSRSRPPPDLPDLLRGPPARPLQRDVRIP